MATDDVDVVIAGSGLAGLAAAAGFGAAGRKVLLIDPAPPVTSAAAPGADLRTTAILQPGQALLERIGAWDRLDPHAAALRVMRIVDAGGATMAPRLSCDFDSAELGDRPFGWNLPNWLIRREMLAHLETLDGVQMATAAFRGALARTDETLVTLSDDRQVAARLLIGADGRNSQVRESLSIRTTTRHYGQKAVVFAVTHPQPHENVSTEVHRSGGPFTLVPLPDHEGRPCSAVVWMEHGPEALRLAEIGAAEFSAEATWRSAGILGPLTLVGPRSVWPIIARVACRFAGPRTALMAEAAHVVPPIGAQGLNMSLADLAKLMELSAGDALGTTAALDAYDRARRPEVTARVMGVDLLNRSSMMGPQPLRDLRRRGLGLLYGMKAVRRVAMRAGLGAAPRP